MDKLNNIPIYWINCELKSVDFGDSSVVAVASDQHHCFCRWPQAR